MSDQMQQRLDRPDAPSTNDDGLDGRGDDASVDDGDVRPATIGTRPNGRDAAGRVEQVLPDQIDRGGPIDEGNAGMWQPNATGGSDETTDWEDRHRLGGPKEL